MIPLEDNYTDILGKAQRGLSLSDTQLSEKAGVSVEDLDRVKGGKFDEALVRKLAGPLKLSADALVALGRNQYRPRDPGHLEGLACFNTAWSDITVNSYLVWDPTSMEGAAFDTGADASGMIEFAESRELRIKLILLTHTHPDHVADLKRLRAVTRAEAWVSRLESAEGAQGFDAGRNFKLGKLSISSRHTSGHSHGGITYVVQGLDRQVAVVGDSIFAGSMGGGMVSYADAIRNNRQHVLTLSDSTILCPGHGPLTTVGEENRHNPFFAPGSDAV